MSVVLNSPENDNIIMQKVVAVKFVYSRKFTFSDFFVLSVDELTLGCNDFILVDPAVKVNKT